MAIVLPMISSPPAAAAPITVPATVTASHWTVAPNVSAPDLKQSGVSCVTSAFCMAVGTLNPSNPSTNAASAQMWNGSSWSSVQVQEPANPSILYAVSCVSASWCVAVGKSDLTNSTYVPLIEQWNGSQFSIVSAASPTNQDSLNGVSCLNTSFCMAVGESAANTLPLFAQWNGTAWSFTTMALSAGLIGPNLNSVSCGAMNNCMAVGSVYNFGIPGQGALAYNWDGSSWSGTLTSNAPAPINNNFLQSVSCVGPWFCAAAGYAYNSSGGGPAAQVPLVEIWNKPSWGAPATLPAPPDFGFGLNGISCFSNTSCTAVGSNILDSHANTLDTAALTWDGQTWAVASTPNGNGNPNTTQFDAVDCLTNWACMAVGHANNGSTDSAFAASAPIARSGYRFVATDGGIFNYGPGAPFLGSLGGTHLNAPIVGMATTPAGDGYYLVASDGGVFGYGSAKFYGSMGGQPLNKPIVGMAVTADGGGYWLVASDGGIFSFGDAQFFGSTGALILNKPVVGMTATPNGLGYYLVASDGGIFNYGNASFAGSMGGQPLNKPIVGIAAPVAGGYYLVASDGGIFSFPTGAAGPPFFGSTGAIVLNKPVIGMTLTAGGKGYYLGAADGGIFSFPEGPAGPTFYGSRGGQPLNAPIVGISG
jgi:hypothetical protein